MPLPAIRPLRTSLAALALALSACAYIPRSSEAARSRALPNELDAPPAAAPEAKVLVTGSRIARPVSARTGLPETFSPVRIYTRADVLRAGLPGDVGATLHRIDPAIGP